MDKEVELFYMQWMGNRLPLHITKEDMLKFAKDFANSQNAWVGVDERLPDEHDEFYWYHGVRVFAELPTGQRLNVDAQWTKNKRFIHNGIDLTEYVTNWQPSPQAPNK